ncbi:MAG TPA: HAD family hydrolase [Flavisolibacter sp.]|nr:HAD family hydrolase [Flavisolibacter sp.]
MRIKVNDKIVFVFDLDDTLYPEIDYLKSAYSTISSKLRPYTGVALYDEMLVRYHKKENVFQWIAETYRDAQPDISFDWLLAEYREHYPSIQLNAGTKAFLKKVKDLSIRSGLITDGRSVTQRNKIKALGIEQCFADIIISEEFGSAKPDEKNYLYFQKKYPGCDFYFFGDNTAKDFIVPAKLGWTTVCLKNTGRHIHPQHFSATPRPDYVISNFTEVTLC